MSLSPTEKKVGDESSHASHGSINTMSGVVEVPALQYDPQRADSYSAVQNPQPDKAASRTPPVTPSQNIQFASYRSDVKEAPYDAPALDRADTLPLLHEGWVPVPLRGWFWIPLVTFMLLLAMGLEIALHFSNKNKGWPTFSAYTTDYGFMHFVYTLPPVIIAMVIVALLAWTDIEIKKMQPYIDLIQGNAPPQKSLLLDYTRTNNFVVWISAFWNQHFMVAFATLIGLLALVFQPLASAMFTVRDTYLPSQVQNVSNLAALGLNHGPAFQDLTAFLSAAGYASSFVLYNLGDPPFVHDVYTVGPFEIPTNVTNNGTVFANTTAVRTDVNCNLMSTISTALNATGWQNNASYDGCTFSYSVDKTSSHLFGTDVMPDCNNTGAADWYRPIVLWFFSYDAATPKGSATHCAPVISLWDVQVEVDIASGNLTSVTEIAPFNANTSPFASLSGNLTGAPMNGQAYNGVAFNLTGADYFVTARAAATDLQLPASIFQSAETSAAGLASTFETDGFVSMATTVYTTYMKLIAKSVYFLPVTDETIQVQVKSFQQRLWMSDVAVHIMVVALLVVALVGGSIQIIHHHSRQQLRLRHQPGTIASAVSIGAQSGVAGLLSGRSEEDDFIRALRHKRFRIDPRTMKLVMEGEPGYETATSPNPRASVFGNWHLQRSPTGNYRFSRSGLGVTPSSA